MRIGIEVIPNLIAQFKHIFGRSRLQTAELQAAQIQKITILGTSEYPKFGVFGQFVGDISAVCGQNRLKVRSAFVLGSVDTSLPIHMKFCPTLRLLAGKELKHRASQ